MIVSKCPLRISLFGGSTDSPAFIKKFESGRVISFTPNLYTYSSLHQDINGFNQNQKKYIVSYSELECSERVFDLKNSVVREFLLYFNIDPLKVSLNADIFSNGSGLASSSSYLLNLVSSYHLMTNGKVDLKSICKDAFEIESRLNPLNGYQDTYGCPYGGIKLIEFFKGGSFNIRQLPDSIFNLFDFYLIYTGDKRFSSNILKHYNIDKSYDLLSLTTQAVSAFEKEDYCQIFDLLNSSWIKKKNNNRYILSNKNLKQIDDNLEHDNAILAHKLCGAGGGGYFLAISEKKSDISFENPYIKIKIDTKGIQTKKI